MNRTQLVDYIAEAAELPKTVAAKALDGVLSGITEALASGDQVALVGFGSFTVRERAARTAKNPQTGELIQIKATKVASFKAGKSLKEAIQTPVVEESEA